MFRAVITRAARRPVIFTTSTRLSRTYPLRWNSSQHKQANGSSLLKNENDKAKKAALEREDDLQRDWDAKVISYVELLPKTQSPSTVSLRTVSFHVYSDLVHICFYYRTHISSTFVNLTKLCKG